MKEINLCAGEPYIIRDNLFEVIGSINVNLNDELWNYHFVPGKKELIKLLEEKYSCRVIVTNGAKQALSAIFYAFKMLKYDCVGLQNPHWSLLNPLANLQNIKTTCDQNYDCMLLTTPNNPDGSYINADEFKMLHSQCNQRKIPIVHDAVYYNHAYVNSDCELINGCDAQIFSASKMLGLSGLRVGWVTCYDERFYELIKEYVQTTTVGVSSLSQNVVYDILKIFEAHPSSQKQFELKSRNDIYKVRNYIKQNLKSSLLHIPENDISTFGMFGWYECFNKEKLSELKIIFSDGTPYGNEKFVRLNLAVRFDIIKEFIDRVNSVK